jgi:cobalt-zinc-cadmium resistance protein CzcA
MLAAILHFALRRRGIVILLAVLLAATGIWAFRQLKIEAYPDISETQVTVITLVAGRAAEEIEQQVTVPVERALQSIPRAISRRSRTIFGLSVVDITFEYGVDDFFARQAVLEKLHEVELPADIVPTLAPPTTPAGELFRYVVEGEGRDEIERREIQDWVIAPRLLQVPGVGDVFAFGGLVKQYQIEIDPQALTRYGLTIQRIAETIGANNENAGGALVDNGQQAMVVRGVGMLRTVGDIERVVVASADGVPVFVRDIGAVRIGAATPRTGIFGMDGLTGGVEGVVVMRRGENASEVLQGVREAVDDLNGTLPDGMRLRPIYDRTELVDHTLHTVSRTLAEGFVIVLAVLLIFLGSLPAALMAAVTIPLALLFAFICMHASGIPANLLSLGALDFGIIIDGTLVMVVHMMRTLADAQAKDPNLRPLDTVREAAGAMERPVFVSVLIIIAAYIPLFGLERVERRMFTPMAYTVCFALVGALLLTMTLVPVLASFVFGNRMRARPNRMFDWIAPRYERLVRAALRRAGSVASVMLVFTLGAVWLSGRLGTEFLPQLDEGVIWIRAALVPGAAIEESAAVAARIRELIRLSPEVAFVTSQTGRQDSNTEPFGPNRNEFLVGLKPYSTWARGRSKPVLIEELAARLKENVPGVTFSFTQPIIDMVTEAVTGSSADLAVIFTGPDLGTLRDLAAQALDVVRQVPGAADTAIEQDADQAQLRITLDREAVARYGLNVEDVQRVIELAIGGQAVSTLYDGDRRFDITVRYIAAARKDMSTIGGILVTTPDGGHIPLSQLAAISVADGASIITRRENRRQINVRTNIRGRDQGGFAADAQRRIDAGISLPPGYRVEWGGQFENLSRASRRLKIIIPLTLFLMFGILFISFESAADAALILLNVPFALIGGVVALLLRGIPFSISAAVGFVSVFGVAIMTGVLFIAEVNRLRSEMGMDVEDAVARAATVRLEQRFLLTLVALLGMVPAATAIGIGSDIQRPMATVIIGGLVSTLILAMVAMPSIYLLASRKRAPSKALLPFH